MNNFQKHETTILITIIIVVLILLLFKKNEFFASTDDKTDLDQHPDIPQQDMTQYLINKNNDLLQQNLNLKNKHLTDTENIHDLENKTVYLNVENKINKNNVKNYKDTLNKVLNLNATQSQTLRELRGDIGKLSDANTVCATDSKNLEKNNN